MSEINQDELEQVSGGLSQPIGIGGTTQPIGPAIPIGPVCELPGYPYPHPFPQPFPGPTVPGPGNPYPPTVQF